MKRSSHPGAYIRKHVIPGGVTVAAAAQLLSVGRPALSNLLNGKAALSPQMAAKLAKAFGADADHLLKMQAAHDSGKMTAIELSSSVREYAPLHLQIKASQIEDWANNIEARSRLAVLLRILAQSSGTRITSLRFPGNDDAELPGWDGEIVAEEGSPWVPVGRSGWEFGTNREPKAKAEKDYNKSLSIPLAERATMTFVFVTPRRWRDKETWRQKKLAESEFKDVRVYDATDLEAWLEQSIVGQTMLAEELRLCTKGVHGIDYMQRRWHIDTDPQLPLALFDDILRSSSSVAFKKLKQEADGRVLIRADSADEALGLLVAILSQPTDDARAWRDRVLLFESVDAVRRLLSQTTRIVPVAADAAVEREIAIAGAPRAIVIRPKGSLIEDVDIDIGLTESEAFRKALEGAGCDRDAVAHLARSSGLSRTVLRRRLSQSEPVRRPAWARDRETAQLLIPLMFAGSWNAAQDADRHIVRALTGNVGDDEIEAATRELAASAEPPVWSIGAFRGVASKVDLIHALGEYVTPCHIDNFLKLAEEVLAEDDPALDLPEDKRWAAGMFGKSRKISSALRQGIRESLLLLAVNGPEIFDRRLGLNIAAQIEQLITRLLTPLSARRLEAQSDELPTYAEAAPHRFLKILEDDLASAKPATLDLLRPVDSSPFASCPRSGLLWALETTAWSRATFRSTIDILARLSEVEINDNWANTPFASLAAALSSWMPQTTVGLDDRLWAYEHIIERHPQVGWRLCMENVGTAGRVGNYSRKPIWRSDAAGAGEHLEWIYIEPTCDKALELMLSRPSYSKEMLADLIGTAEALSEEHENRIWDVVSQWADTAHESDKAWLNEKIRTTVRFNQLRVKKRTNVRSLARARLQHILSKLSPADLVLRHAWLFEKHWIDYSADEIYAEELDLEGRDERNRAIRQAALSEILKKGGLADVLRLCAMSKAPDVIGDTLFALLDGQRQVRDALYEIMRADTELEPHRRRALVSALVCRMDHRDRHSFLGELFSQGHIETAFELVVLAPFDADTWGVVDSQNEETRRRYWRDVQPTWFPDDQASFHRAVRELLDAERATTVWLGVKWQCKRLEPTSLVRLLRALAEGTGEPLGETQLYPHDFEEAFEAVHASGVLSTTELAQLEFVYLEVLRSTDYALPGLHKHLAENPGMLAEIVSMIYRPDTASADAGGEKKEIADDERRRAEKGYRLKEMITQIPHAASPTAENKERCLAWIVEARKACAKAGRAQSGDSTLGQWLGRTQEGRDGVWPNETIREILDDIASERLVSAMVIGRLNTRGASFRGRGGTDERELAERYRLWSDRLALRYPKAAEVCRRIMEHYEALARWHDEREDVERRVRPW